MGAVSPAALDMVKITPVKIPGKAFGNTTSLIVSSWVAPKASVASRMLLGILFSASSVVVMIYGSESKPSVKPADKTEVPNFRD